MLLAGLILVVLTLTLFQISRRVYRQIFLLFYHLTHRQNLSIRFLLVFLLPGTIIHELSHFIMAIFMGVPTGTINLIPKIKKDGEVVAGETKIAQCDPIRYTMIGIAPFIVGIAIIYTISNFFLFKSVNNFDSISLLLFPWQHFAGTSLIFLLVLIWVSNTMFSSRKDLQLMIVPLLLLYMIGFIVYFSGYKLELSREIYDNLLFFLVKLNYFVVFTLMLNLILWMMVKTIENIVFRLGKNQLIC